MSLSNNNYIYIMNDYKICRRPVSRAGMKGNAALYIVCSKTAFENAIALAINCRTSKYRAIIAFAILCKNHEAMIFDDAIKTYNKLNNKV